MSDSNFLPTVIQSSMAESGSSGLGFRLDIKQILSEAQHRWLRPAEIVEILRNYQKFHISPAAPNKPVSGSVFLFDRKVLRYFRKDGHNWRKKKDGKTVKEAHEKLKVGSVDMLHCYYAHGEDNENFQRRSYWLLEQDLMHIVFAHYLEVKGNKTNISSSRNNDTVVSNSENNSVLLSSSFHGTSPSSTLSSACEDAESEDNHQASSRFHSFPDSPLTDGSHYVQSSSYNPISSPGQTAFKQESGCYLPVQANWQDSFEDFSLKLHIPTMNQNPILNLPPDQDNTLFEQSEQKNLQMLLSEAETGHAMNQNMENLTSMGNENYSLFLKKPSISGLQKEENLKKTDSFSRWIAKELGEYDELSLQSNNGISWSGYGMPAQLQVDLDTLNPSISQDQLFSIMDFSPNWTYTNMTTKVLITGIFLKSEQELSKCRWSIMFGQVEVAAEVLADGILCCRAPLQKPGLVPFYVTCSNRLACSEIREFEYRFEQDQSMGGIDERGSTNVMHLYQRFETMLSLETSGSDLNSSGNDFGKQNIINKIFSFMEEENNQEIKLTPKKDTTELMVIGELLLQKQLKEKFYAWLFHKLSYDKESIADVKGGQGVLHLAAALGFNWALQPIIVSGISIDFRDVNGWTALHWAAHYGREDTVAALVSLGASPGALTDPSAEYPLGRTPADLASSSGHKGISGFLAETTLTTHLSTLGVDDPLEDGTSGFSGSRAVQTVSERLAVPTTGEDVPDTLSLKDSLAAICNATQAAARIHQIFRTQSFHRKQLLEHGGDESVTPNEQAISLVAGKNSRLGRASGGANAAAVRIQKKFRGWKKRKEFLLIRLKVVKIQAHFRGHQVRKKYKTIIWSVGIMEKVILRWRRKRSGLRGFRSDAVAKVENVQGTLPQEDDYDFLKEGRKQTEERMQKALARVKSMAQYPEARAQYRRLLTAAEGFRETKDASDAEIQESSDDMFYPQDDLIDIESLLDDDTFMSLAFQ